MLGGLYAAEGLRTPDGGSVLPALEPATVQRLQGRFTSYSAANPDGPIQLVAADPRQLVDMFREQYTAMAQNAQSIIRHIHAGQATVGALAAFIRKPLRARLLQRGCDMIPAVTPDLALFGAELDTAQSALDHAVFIEC